MSVPRARPTPIPRAKRLLAAATASLTLVFSSCEKSMDGAACPCLEGWECCYEEYVCRRSCAELNVGGAVSTGGARVVSTVDPDVPSQGGASGDSGSDTGSSAGRTPGAGPPTGTIDTTNSGGVGGAGGAGDSAGTGADHTGDPARAGGAGGHAGGDGG